MIEDFHYLTYNSGAFAFIYQYACNIFFIPRAAVVGEGWRHPTRIKFLAGGLTDSEMSKKMADRDCSGKKKIASIVEIIDKF